MGTECNGCDKEKYNPFKNHTNLIPYKSIKLTYSSDWQTCIISLKSYLLDRIRQFFHDVSSFSIFFNFNNIFINIIENVCAFFKKFYVMVINSANVGDYSKFCILRWLCFC